MQQTMLTLCLVVGLPLSAFGQPRPAKLAQQAKGVLQKHCYQCHGEGGRAEADRFILNYQSLIDAALVVPKDLNGSKLYVRLAIEKDMPPETTDDGEPIPRPGEKDVAVIKAWIEAGAPSFTDSAPKRDFISNQDVLESILADLLKAGERDRKFLRYFTITHLYNAGLPDDELQSYRVGLSKLVNSLSWGREIHVPQPVDPAQTIHRIDLRDLEWDENVWDAILAENPYGVRFNNNKTATACYTYTQSPLPYVRADWFVFAASKPPLYYQALRLPKTAGELEERLELDVAKNLRQERVWRAGFNGSGVSRNNRLIERHRSPYGAYWKSYDFAGNVGRKNLFEHPLGPGEKSGEFQPDGGELIFNLPNGLQAYFLIDARGDRLDRGPTNIVSDPKQGDRAVVNGVSCMSCHARGMIAKDDQIRAHVENNSQAFEKNERELILALYPKKDEFDARMKEDAVRFQNAVKQTGAHLSKSEPVYLLAKRFEDAVDLRLAAAEAGTTVAEFKAGLDRSRALARVFGPLNVAGGRIQRDVLVASFGDLVRELLPAGTFVASRTQVSSPNVPNPSTNAAGGKQTSGDNDAEGEKAEKASGSLDGIDYLVDRVTRSSARVTLHIVATNTMDDGAIIPAQVEAVDDDGNTYTASQQRMKQVTVRKGIKARFEVVLTNVPRTLAEFRRVDVHIERLGLQGQRMVGASREPVQFDNVRIGK